MKCKNCGHDIEMIKIRYKSEKECFHICSGGISKTCTICGCKNPQKPYIPRLTISSRADFVGDVTGEHRGD